MAKKKISELPAGGALNGTELVPIVQTGTTKRITAQDIANLGNASGVEGSGTINYLSKFTATSTIGNSQFFDNGTSIGLGTATPNASYKLDIVGNLRATTIVKLGGTSVEYLKADGSVSTLTNPITGTGTTNYLPKFTGASALGNSNLINDANGQLGLGVTPSAWSSTLVRAIQVGNLGASISSYTALNTSTPFMFVDNNAYYDGTNDKYILNRAAARYVQVAGEHQWLTAPTGTAGNAITFTQAMTLDASGRLGIGTTSPLAILDVFQTGQPQLRVRGTAGANHLYQDSITGTSNSDGLFVGIGSDQIGYIFQYEAKDLVFGTNTTERMRITSGGNVLIGTTTDAGYKLDVAGTLRNQQYHYITNTFEGRGLFADDGYGTNMFSLTREAGNITRLTCYEAFEVFTNGTAKMTITNAGSAIFTQSVTIGNKTTTQINALTPATGMVVFNTTLATLCFYDGSGWRKVSHSSM